MMNVLDPREFAARLELSAVSESATEIERKQKDPKLNGAMSMQSLTDCRMITVFESRIGASAKRSRSQ